MMLCLLLALAILSHCTVQAQIDTISLTSLDISAMKQDYGNPRINRSVIGKPLRIAGKEFSQGIGTHASSKFTLDLQGNALRIEGLVGIDEGIFPEKGSAEFLIIADGAILWQSGIMNRTMQAKGFSIDLTGKATCELLVFDGNDNIFSDHANWVETRFFVTEGFIPKPHIRPIEPEYILTPDASLLPKIHGKSLYGAKTGSEILHYVPVTGLEPLTITMSELPSGLFYDSTFRVIRGSISQRGVFPVNITAENPLGKAEQLLTFRIGDTISFSPPIGWSSWYAHWEYVTEKDIYKAAHALRSSGLQNYGYEYMLIDDGWQDTSHSASMNGLKPSSKFPNLPLLIDSLHTLGFKVGIYSSPGSHTCVQLPGSLGHEVQDAEYFCSIKADLVKYDWCGYQTVYDSLLRTNQYSPEDLAKAPYASFAQVLQTCNRDMFYMICQYGNNDVWKWGRSVGGHAWRTTTDIQDNWWSMSNIVGFRQAGLEAYSGHNGWNDMDHLRLGNSQPKPYTKKTDLTPHEQYTQVSLWAMLNSPLILSMHMDSLDAFTLSLLKNQEILALHQDPLGLQGSRIFKNVWQEIWRKPLSNGGNALAFFNRDDVGEQTISITTESLGLQKGIAYMIKDLWTHEEYPLSGDILQYSIPSHGVKLLTIAPKEPISSIGNEEGISKLTIVPQPAQDIIYCSFHSPHSGIGKLEIVTVDGRILEEPIQLDIQKGIQAFAILLPSNISSGLHALKISTTFSTIFHPIHIVH
jgi:alpha-galactosidase